MVYKQVDVSITMVVGPCIDDTNFKSLEEAIAYNAAGMDISLIIEKADGTTTVTAITLTTGGTSDWTHKDGGYYEVEITAAQNAEEGIAHLRGVCDGVLPFESPRYDIVVANVYNSLVTGTDVLQTDVTQWLGTGVHANVAGYPSIDLISMGGATQSLIDLKDFADNCYDPVNDIVPVNITQLLGTAIATPTIAGVLEVDLTHMGGVAQSAADLKLFADDCYTPATGLVNSNLTRIQGTSQSAADLKDFVDNCYIPGTNSISLVDTCTTNTDIGVAGAGLTDLGGMSTGMKAEVNVEAKDVIAIDTIADSYATDGAQPTLVQAVLAIQQHLQEMSISGTTLTIKKPDGSTTAMTFTLDNATTPTSITRAT